jgi:hypothetical protein
MAAYLIPEEAETALWRADLALRALIHTLDTAGAKAAEISGEELAALLEVVRGQVAEARACARFDARAE